MRTLIIIFTVILTSCSSNNELDKKLNKIGVKFRDKYTVLANESSFAIGDVLSKYKVKISEEDYNSLIKTIKNTKGFQVVQTNHVPIENYPGPNPNIKKTAWTRDGMYAYEVIIQDTIGSGFENFIMYVDKDKTIDFTYADE